MMTVRVFTKADEQGRDIFTHRVEGHDSCRVVVDPEHVVPTQLEITTYRRGVINYPYLNVISWQVTDD